VAAAAAEAGIEILFTSEPTSRAKMVNGCLVVGRYAIRNGTSAQGAAALAAGSPLACAGQCAAWNTRKVAKRILGGRYHSLRDKLIGS